MSRKPLTARQAELLSGATGWDAEKIQRYRENLWAADFDVPGMDGFVAKVRRGIRTAARVVAGLGRSAVRHAKRGFPKPPPEVIEARRAICKACPNWTGGQCRLCWCAIRAKTAWAGESCPDKPARWSAWPPPAADESATPTPDDSARNNGRSGEETTP